MKTLLFKTLTQGCTQFGIKKLLMAYFFLFNLLRVAISIVFYTESEGLITVWKGYFQFLWESTPYFSAQCSFLPQWSNCWDCGTKKKPQTIRVQIKYLVAAPSPQDHTNRLYIMLPVLRKVSGEQSYPANHQRPIFGCLSNFKSNGHWCFGSVCQLLRKISGKLGLGKCLTFFTSHLFTTFFKACSMQSVCVSYCVVSGWPQIYRKQHCFFCLANQNNMLKAARSCRVGC